MLPAEDAIASEHASIEIEARSDARPGRGALGVASSDCGDSSSCWSSDTRSSCLAGASAGIAIGSWAGMRPGSTQLKRERLGVNHRLGSAEKGPGPRAGR